MEKKNEEVRPMGGMIKGKWSGMDHWECPRCGSTTFEEIEADIHTCQGRVVKYAKGDEA